MKTRKVMLLLGIFCLVCAFGQVDHVLAKAKVKLKFTTTIAPKGPTFSMFKQVCEEIKKQSNGEIDYRITIQER